MTIPNNNTENGEPSVPGITCDSNWSIVTDYVHAAGEKLESLGWSQISPHFIELDGSNRVHKSPPLVPKSKHINPHIRTTV